MALYLILNEVSMPFNADSHLSAEVAGQPSDWEAVTARLPEFAPILPSRGARVAVLGCGTSYYMAQAYAARRELSGHGETDAFAASEHRLSRGYDAVLVISRSGTTTEAIDVLRYLNGRDLSTTAIVATPGTPVAQLADHAIVLPEVDERSVVQTRFATSTLALLRASLGEDLADAIDDARAILGQDEADCLAGLIEAEQFTFLGRGWTIGLAEEAALKLRESAQFWTEAYPAMEYRHGPVSIATTERAVWAFGEVPDGLAAEVAATGAHFEHRRVDPLAELVRVHRLCLRKARDKDLDPDQPRHLTRSVILAPDADRD
ncbi:MAG TPA: SIS domain-containing protein [Propionibacteriaceae bacterium]|nr:SIS domain-containing protein [Propionibacteriaceae bacterium]